MPGVIFEIKLTRCVVGSVAILYWIYSWTPGETVRICMVGNLVADAKN